MSLDQLQSKSQYQPKSPYETPKCKILVGEGEAKFEINEGILQSTSFFAKHGVPKRHRPGCSNNLTARERSSTVGCTGSDLFLPEGTPHTSRDNRGVSIDLTDTDADYELKGQFYYCRDAFALFVRHLHDAELKTPSDQAECEALFQAYALGQHYDVHSLKTAVIRRLQLYYKEYLIPITDLIYVIENRPNNADPALLLYLLAQVGFEMARNWVEYRSKNKEMEQLFSSNNPIIIEQLLQAVSQHATPHESADPAKCKRFCQLTLV